MSAERSGDEGDLTRPRAGRSVAGSVTPLARALQAAVEDLALGLPQDFALEWLEETSQWDWVPASPVGRAAWNVAALTALYALATGNAAGLAAALRWFGDDVGAATVPENGNTLSAERHLQRVVSDPASQSLFPYLLDTFGPTSRLDVLRDENLTAQRSARKDAGSFYTPSDVADFMVSSIMGDDPAREVWFDPACGSGVFLVAVIKALAQEGIEGEQLVAFATGSLFGTDLSPQALDFAAFSVCQRLLGLSPDRPRDLWRAVRKNLVAIDALRVADRVPVSRPSESLEGIFGPIERPLRLICNPPYAERLTTPGDEFWASFSGGPANKSLYLPFVEMAWRLACGPLDKAALVVPLAVATNSSQDHARCREALQDAGGAWSMLFFDRQPHALFGEEAKTRNAIIIRRSSDTPIFRTSGLLKWTSKQRESIFHENRVVELGHPRLKRFIPKLATEVEAALYDRLGSYQMRSAYRPRVSSVMPALVHATKTERDVFVGGTAYNFLNVAKDYPSPEMAGGKLSASKLHRLSFATAEDAYAGFAILASRFAFWLWHVECDGFHVPTWFLQDLPIFDLPFSPDHRRELGRIGEAMWRGASEDLLASKNAGKWTFAFRPTRIKAERAEADAVLLDAATAPPGCLEAFARFEERVVSVDGRERLAKAGEYEKIIMRGLHT